jgi:CPA2 family monovalent cation:H+ antiporter-2
MPEYSPGVLREVIILLAAAVIAVAVFQRLRLPSVLAYLLVGALLGPHALGWLPEEAERRWLAEFGVVFLLFSVGLQFSLSRFLAMRREVLTLGGGQVLATVCIVALVARSLDFSWAAAFILGGVLAMSSTAVVIKQLTEQAEGTADHSRQAIGILLFQDLAVLPFLILMPLLAGDSDTSAGLEMVSALGKGALIVLLMLAAGRWLLRPMLQEIARSHSAELFTLAALLFALTAAAASYSAGLSMPLGAFLAGMMLGETEFRHQIEADIRPFKDVLLGLFFVTVGMLLDPRTLLTELALVLWLLGALLLGKALIVAGLGRLAGTPRSTAIRTATVLAAGGEFGLALLSLALAAGLVAPRIAQVVLAALLLSMAVAPLLVRWNGAIAQRLAPESFARTHARVTAAVRAAAHGLSDHVLICGYGRIGQRVARFLDQEGTPYIALDLDPVRVREAHAAGEPVGYGDATQTDVLAAAGLARARVLVVSFDDVEAAERIIGQIRSHGNPLPILVRTRDDYQLERLQRAGATEVVPETLEASLMLAAHLLLLLEVPSATIMRHVQAVRRDRYRLLRGLFAGEEEPQVTSPLAHEQLHAVTLPAQARAVGMRLSDLQLGEAGATVTAVRRGGIRGRQPAAGMVLRADDTLVLYGTPEALETAEERLLRG